MKKVTRREEMQHRGAFGVFQPKILRFVILFTFFGGAGCSHVRFMSTERDLGKQKFESIDMCPWKLVDNAYGFIKLSVMQFDL